MSNKNREYNELMQKRKKEHSFESDSTAQNRYSYGDAVLPTTAIRKNALFHEGRMSANNGVYQKSEHYMGKKYRPSKKHMKHRLLVAVSAVIIIFLVSFITAKLCNRDVLDGVWDLDGITVYRFDGKGNGKLDLPDSIYPFAYKINGNSVSIDFESEAARDITYSFTVNKERLVLVSIENGKEVTYELIKKNSK